MDTPISGISAASNQGMEPTRQGARLMPAVLPPLNPDDLIGALIAKQKARALFDARNRGDLDAFLAAWSDDAVYVFPGEAR